MALSKRCKRIFDTHYSDVFDQRSKELSDIILQFYANTLTEVFDFNASGYSLLIDESRVAHLLKSYYYDVIRYKDFHFSSEAGKCEESIHFCTNEGGKHINIYKQAAYMVKWIVRVKPLMIEKNDSANMNSTQEKLRLTLNEYFAIIYAECILKSNIDQSEYEKYVYQLHYRPYEEGAFERIFEKLESA